MEEYRNACAILGDLINQRKKIDMLIQQQFLIIEQLEKEHESKITQNSTVRQSGE